MAEPRNLLRRALLLLTLWPAAAPMATPSPTPVPVPAATDFAAYDVFVDSGERSLGAFQFEWKVTAGSASIVGVEGGDGAAFARAPYYDPAALQGGRILVAGMATAADLPHGRTRVARLHLQIGAGAAPQFAATLQAVADGDGQRFAAGLTWQKTENK